jgi:predicted dehydrogenase
MLKGVLFGAGRMGGFHRAKIAARPGVELVVVDPPLGLRPDVGEVDFAIVATPSSTHREVAEPLLERGVPCLVEKPLAHTVEDARALAAYRTLMVGHIERFNPALVPVRAVRPRFVQCERLAPFPARGTDVSVIDDLMVHDLDLVSSFLGTQVTDVRAIGVGVLTAEPDICNVRLEIGGAVAVLTASRVSRESVRKLRLVEPGVYWSVDLLARTVTRVDWGTGDLTGSSVAVPNEDALEREHDAFFAAVRGEAAFDPDGAAGVRALELAAVVRRAL